jgi:pseudouridine synthase
MHPRYGVSKTYLAEIHGPIGRDLGRRLTHGVQLADGFAKADDFRVFDQVGKRILVEVTLHEGRKHIVRRLLAEAGHPVQQLARTEFGPVKLGRLRSGTIRALSTKEIGELYAAVEL